MEESSMDFSAAPNKEELEEAAILRQLQELQAWTERAKNQSLGTIFDTKITIFQTKITIFDTKITIFHTKISFQNI